MSEQELQAVKDCQAGELARFGFLYDSYIRKIYDFVYYKVQHKESAEDIVSEVFMKALAKIGGFDAGKGTFQAWLYMIARNAVIDHYRTKKSPDNIEDHWGLADGSDAERDLDARLKLEQVDGHLRKLKAQEREIIIMRVWQEMSYREIAEALGKSEGACKMAYSRAVSRLRMELPMAALIFLLLHG